MGKNDYELVEKVSAAFAEQGKKTVVVVKSSFPVGMEEIEKIQMFQLLCINHMLVNMILMH